jgi:hypothetical protein
MEEDQEVANGTNNDWPIPKYIERARSVSTWQKARFRPSDAEQYQRTPTGQIISDVPEIIPAGWDHEHCMLCMTTISELPDCQCEGYNNEEENLWLCVACYERYISPSQK